MKTLTELVAELEPLYTGVTHEMEDFDFVSGKIMKVFPAYLFRGENKLYPDTQSGYARRFYELQEMFEEYNYWVRGRDLQEHKVINQDNLIFYIRKRLLNIEITEHDYNNINDDISVAAYLQHYGLDMSFIDLTSNLNVAAFFAVYGATSGSQGSLLVQPVLTFQNMLFDLRNEKLTRPKQQEAFAINTEVGFDLKSADIISSFQLQWFSFLITEEDIKKFIVPDLMELTDGDIYADFIVEWYEEYIKKNLSVSDKLKSYFQTKVDLINKCKAKPVIY